MEDSRIISDVAYNERSLLRNKRKRPWGRHTRGPFRGIEDENDILFKDRLILTVEIEVKRKKEDV